MRFGYIFSERSGEVDGVLSQVADTAMAGGIRLAGAVQPALAGADLEKCRIILRLLPDGPVRDVSLDLGTGATGCRLDAGALEEAAMEVMDRLPPAQALIVNKFGKQEAVGRGLVTAMGEACARGLPILAGLSPEWRDAFLAFCDGEAEALPCDPDAVFNWLQDALRDAA